MEHQEIKFTITLQHEHHKGYVADLRMNGVTFYRVPTGMYRESDAYWEARSKFAYALAKLLGDTEWDPDKEE